MFERSYLVVEGSEPLASCQAFGTRSLPPSFGSVASFFTCAVAAFALSVLEAWSFDAKVDGAELGMPVEDPRDVGDADGVDVSALLGTLS